MNEHTFSPRIGYGETELRQQMTLSEEDYEKIEGRPRWEAVVTDLNTGRSYFARAASCGSPGCYCDAVASEVVPLRGKRKPNLLEAAKIALSLLEALQSEYEEEITPMSRVPWPPVEALRLAIRDEEAKQVNRGKLLS